MRLPWWLYGTNGGKLQHIIPADSAISPYCCSINTVDHGITHRHREDLIQSPLQTDEDTQPDGRPNAVANWLLFVACLVFTMVVVGGITRLTESGLSITEWKPVTGALPPIGQAEWLAEFEKYKATPEYNQNNAGMTLAQFQFIYFWEWAHRLLARLVGVAFALPFLWFAVKRAIPKGYYVRLIPLFLLGGLQGVIGWWMVVSGLSERTDVSHFRLATHLLLALFILAALIWTALDLKALAKNASAKSARFTGFSAIIALILFIQLLFGAYVAGLSAGAVSNSWPLMNDQLVPAGIEFRMS